MNVIYGSWGDRQTHACGRHEASSGYDNIPMFLDNTWHNLSQAQHIPADLVLCATPAVHYFELVKKSTQWAKLIMMQESGYDLINCVPYFECFLECPVDGYLLHNKDLIPFYEVFGKPVHYFEHPYFWEKACDLNAHPKEPNRVMVNFARYGGVQGNPAGTLAIIKKNAAR